MDAAWMTSLGLVTPLGLAACGGADATSPDAAVAADANTSTPDATPGTLVLRDLGDDLAPYALPATCAGLPTWDLGEFGHVERVAAVSSSEAWVVISNALVHLRADGSQEPQDLPAVTDVWRCPGVTWAVGQRGMVARRADGGAWTRMDLPLAAPDDVFIFDGGVGCDGEVWVGVSDGAYLHDGNAWRFLPTVPHPRGDGTFLELDLARIRGTGRTRVATSIYGSMLRFDEPTQTWLYVGGTDDLATDVFVRRDGTGVTFFGGLGLEYTLPDQFAYAESPITGERVVRRSDQDLWVTSGQEVRHVTAGEIATTATTVYAYDVDARADAVWIGGFQGAEVRSQAGWCHVAVAGSAAR